MNEKRRERIGTEIKKVVSEMIQDGLKDPKIHPMTSVMQVKVTNDLSYANIYISVLGTEKEKEETIQALDRAKGYIRKVISKEIDLRHTPDPKFHLDRSIEDSADIHALIQKVRTEDDERHVEE